MPELSPAELRELLQKLDDVCRQAQDLQRHIREKMDERALGDRQGQRCPHS